MSITLPQSPAGADALLREHNFGVSAGKKMASASVGSDLSITRPHRVYSVARDAIVGGELLSAAQPIAWRYVLVNSDSALAAAELIEDAGGGLSFSDINYGPFVQATADVLIAAEKLDDVQRGEFELRLLRIPSVYLVAVWLHGDGTDLLLPLAPAPVGLEAGRVYGPQEVLEAIKSRAETAAALDDR